MNTRESLDHAMREVLNQLSVCAHVGASGYGGGGSSSTDEHPGGGRPPGDLDLVVLQHRYGPPFHHCEPSCHHHGPASNDDERAQVLKDAQNELEHIRRRGTRDVAAAMDDPDVARAEMLTETEGYSPDQVAQSRWRTPARLVRRNRIADGRDPETGKKMEGKPETGDPASRARELAGQGLSLRQIGLLVGKDQKQIQRYLGRAA